MKRQVFLILIATLFAAAVAGAQSFAFDALSNDAAGLSGVGVPAAIPEAVAAAAPDEVIPAEAPSEREWLVLVFISGVNDLGILGYANKDINEMEQVGSTDKVAVVAEYNILSTDGSADRNLRFERKSKTLHIQRDADPDITSPVIRSNDELDMGSWKHLVKFARRNMQLFPAKKVLLVLWNHGSGTLGIASDDVSGNKISIKDLGKALAQIKAAKGGKIDVFATDACLMQMAGVVNELKGHADILVGSEEIISGPGYPYHTILQAANADPGMGAEGMARAIVAAYDAVYASSRATLSAVRSDMVGGFIARLDNWTGAVMSDPAALRAAASDAVINGTFYFKMPDSKDLGDYVDQVAAALPAGSPAIAAGEELKNYIKDSLLVVSESGVADHYNEGAGWPYTGRTHGIAVYIPQRIYDSRTYESLSIAADSRWDDFLRALMAQRLK